VSCGDAIQIMQREGFDQMPVVDASGAIAGMVTQGNLLALLSRNKLKATDNVSAAVYKAFKKVGLSHTLGQVIRILEKEHFVLVCSKSRCFTKSKEVEERTTIVSMVTHIDVLKFIMARAPASR
jgi:cystathionine beta-synthase